MPASITDDDLIMFVGDTHGDMEFWLYLFEEAKKYPTPIKTFVQLGDFGYWEHDVMPDRYKAALEQHGLHHLSLIAGWGAAYLDHLNECMVDMDAYIYWIDGNHENHKLLRHLYGPGGSRYQSGPHGTWRVRSNVIYIPRATAFVWGDTKFLAIGGAYSIDKEGRLQDERDARRVEMYKERPGYQPPLYEGVSNLWESWWEDETISDEERDKARAIGKVDVVLAHDTPGSVDLLREFAKRGKTLFKGDNSSQFNRNQCEQVLVSALPANWLNGHYHMRYTQYVPLEGANKCRVIALDCNMNRTQASYLVATPADLRDPNSRIT